MVKFKDKIFKKKSYYEISIPSEFKVQVKAESKITKNSILIARETLVTDEETSRIKSPFNAIVKKINSNSVVLEFESTQLGLIDAKGDAAIGIVHYISQKELSLQKYKLQSYEGSIIVTDFMDSKIYPKLSAMGIVGIATNSIDFELFNDIVTLAVPVGVISGFGLLKEDKSLVEWFESVEGHTAILDGRYNKLIFPEYDKN